MVFMSSTSPGRKCYLWRMTPNSRDIRGVPVYLLPPMSSIALFLVALVTVASGVAFGKTPTSCDALRAIESGDNAKLHQLIKAGLDVDGTGGQFNESFLNNAVLLGKPAAAAILIAAGADIEAITGTAGGLTPLARAANVCDLKTAELLVARGANVNARTGGVLSSTPLLLALSDTFVTFGDCFSVVQFLLEEGADVNAAKGWFGGEKGHNTVMLATYRADSRFMQALLARGANPNSSWSGKSALESAVETFLVISNFDKKRDEKSAREGLAVIRALVEAGAKLDVRTRTGKSLVDLVEEKFRSVCEPVSLADPKQTVVVESSMKPARSSGKPNEARAFYEGIKKEILKLVTQELE